MRILTVIGARPQFIKAAVVSRALHALPGVEELIVHTGQHYDPNLSEIFFQELGIPRPARHLGVGGGGHGAQTGRMLEALDGVIQELEPDWVLVYGDTNSTTAGALSAAKLHVPVAHVEAGLRSFNRRMPEELNRVVTDHLSDLLFAPTETALRNLAEEGLRGANVHLVGDVMYDAALMYGERAGDGQSLLEELAVGHRQYVLATVHRAENTDDPARLEAIFHGLAAFSRRMPVVWPLHPRTRKALQALGLADKAPFGLRLADPVGYLDMVCLEKHAALIATDSGGVQKEAYFHRVPCVTLREETEWVELVELGWNRLAPPASAEAVASAVGAALGSHGRPGSPYGYGHAAVRIAEALASAKPGAKAGAGLALAGGEAALAGV